MFKVDFAGENDEGFATLKTIDEAMEFYFEKRESLEYDMVELSLVLRNFDKWNGEVLFPS